ncbi:hypothetical protein [Roseibium sp. Sym1]|uniref:hypothetical protein n=1 Tax=Roseibium sp. Sym1 TaxID=3016006 RepID=UPI0022B34903|nr:hypothetical protein [Roseibium sp. Sym1]
MNEQRSNRPAERVRQGERGRPVLAILLTSLALVAVAFVGLSLLQTAGMDFSIGAIDGTGQAADLTQ